MFERLDIHLDSVRASLIRCVDAQRAGDYIAAAIALEKAVEALAQINFPLVRGWERFLPRKSVTRMGGHPVILRPSEHYSRLHAGWMVRTSEYGPIHVRSIPYTSDRHRTRVRIRDRFPRMNELKEFTYMCLAAGAIAELLTEAQWQIEWHVKKRPEFVIPYLKVAIGLERLLTGGAQTTMNLTRALKIGR